MLSLAQRRCVNPLALQPNVGATTNGRSHSSALWVVPRDACTYRRQGSSSSSLVPMKVEKKGRVVVECAGGGQANVKALGIRRRV